MLGDIVPPSLVDAMNVEADEESQQRLRLLYVACTRAMDMLVLPELPSRGAATWSGAIDHGLPGLPELNVARFPKKPPLRAADRPNGQSREVFESEQGRVAQALGRICWIRPSDGDPDVVAFETAGVTAWDQPIERIPVAEGGSFRGIVLHKLMEELLTGEVQDSTDVVRQRAAILVEQLASATRLTSEGDVEELAKTALRTFALPELARDKENLVAEVPVYGRIAGDDRRLITGRADAVRYKDRRAYIVFDWKSDIAPESASRDAYARQLALYVDVLGAERGAVVYMTSGQIEWVTPADSASGMGGGRAASAALAPFR
jgi:CRISPR-associated exonuclease Cas4